MHTQAAVFLRFRPWHGTDGLRRSAAVDARRGTDAADAALDTEAGPTWRTGGRCCQPNTHCGAGVMDIGLSPVERFLPADAMRRVCMAMRSDLFAVAAEPLPKGTALDPEAAATLEDENNHMLACAVVSVATR